MKEYISVAEFARLSNVSVQAIYKKYSNQFKTINGMKMLEKSLLDDKPLNNDLNAINREIVELLRQELTAKDRQIQNLNEHILNLEKLLDQEQKLNAININNNRITETAPADAAEPPQEELEKTEKEIYEELKSRIPKPPRLLAPLKDRRTWFEEFITIVNSMTEKEQEIFFRLGKNMYDINKIEKYYTRCDFTEFEKNWIQPSLKKFKTEVKTETPINTQLNNNNN